MAQHRRRAGRDRDQLFRLPGDAIARPQALEQRQEIGVFAVHQVRSDVDRVAARRVRPAACAPTELTSALQHHHAQPAVGKRYGAGESRQPAADDGDVGGGE